MDWDQVFKAQAWGRYPAEELVRFICREQPKRVLEIGCGPGANLWLLADQGIDIHAVDSSPAAIDQAALRLNKECPQWRGALIVGDFLAMPKWFTGYDAVIDSEALCCVDFESAKRVISDIRERLNPGGAFWSRTFSAASWDGPLRGARKTAFDEIPALYGDWASINVGEITRHNGNDKEMVREWIITARK